MQEQRFMYLKETNRENGSIKGHIRQITGNGKQADSEHSALILAAAADK